MAGRRSPREHKTQLCGTIPSSVCSPTSAPPGSIGRPAGVAVVRACVGGRELKIYDRLHTPSIYKPPRFRCNLRRDGNRGGSIGEPLARYSRENPAGAASETTTAVQQSHPARNRPPTVRAPRLESVGHGVCSQLDPRRDKQ